MKYFIIIIIVISLIVFNAFLNRRMEPAEIQKEGSVLSEDPREIDTPTKEPKLNGNDLLAGYGDPSTRPEEDLQKVQRVIQGFLILFKTLDNRFIATNPQMTSVLTGDNREKLQWLNPDLPIFSDGQMLDRWGTPYVIHPIGKRLIEIRSFGPDKISGTEDDYAINPDGAILRGLEIN